MAAKKKTDNAFLMDKVMLRVNHLPEGDIRVLDCFSGKGLIWTAVKQVSGRNIVTLPIDKRSDKDDFHLPGDNLDYLETIDLSKYNVVDLDAYGVPFDQIRTLFEKRYKGRVFVTAISQHMSYPPFALLEEIGFTRQQIDKVPTLFARRGWSYLLQYLAKHGIARIHHRSKDTGRMYKHYFTFEMLGSSSER